MALTNVRIEVMNTLEQSIDDINDQYLKSAEECWQPSDFLPDSRNEDFYDQVKEYQELANEMDSDILACLVGNTITEEALPTYESWLMDLEGVQQGELNGWTKWIRNWTAEENRHGVILNTFLYLTGRINMKEVEITTQYLIADGFDIGTGHDPYRNFVYTSFQELATNVSHRRMATLAKKAGHNSLAKMCGVVASDEARHAKAYIEFVRRIFDCDPSEMMLAFADMMKKKIVMPAHFLRESGGRQGELFERFSESAQRIGVYTSLDYIEIFRSLLDDWKIGQMTGLNDAANRARDYVMNLPDRIARVAERVKIPKEKYNFKWIAEPSLR